MGDKTIASKCKDAPLLSVVVPVYNTADYLEECLDSLCNQSFASIEIICVDDGSSDESSVILDNYARKDSRVIVYHRENSGVSAARNYGISRASGRYILFVDSDDFVELNMCERLLEAAHKDNSDIVVFGGVTFPHVGWIDRCLDTRDVFVSGNGIAALLEETGSFPLMCNKMYRRSLIVDNGLSFSTDLALGEDNAFQFSVFPHARNVTFLSDAFYHYRCDRAGSAISRFYEDRLAKVCKHLDVIRHVFCDWRMKGIIKDNAKELLRWSSGFLHGDLIELEYRDRCEIGQAYKECCERYGLLSAIDELDPFERKICSFLCLCDGQEDERVVSVIMVPGSEEHADECFRSISSQSFQSLEMLLVDDGRDVCAFRDIARRDLRTRSFGSFEEAVAAARGEYALVVTGDTVYDWLFVERMLLVAQREDADIVSCFDYGNRLCAVSEGLNRILRTRNKGVYSPSGCAPDKRYVAFSPSDAPEYVLSALSPSLANKLVRLDCLKRHCDSGVIGSFSLIVDTQIVSVVPYPFVTLRSRALSCEQARVCANSCVRIVEDYFKELRGNREESALVDSWALGSAGLILSNYDLVSNYDGKKAFVDEVGVRLKKTDAVDAIFSSELLPGDIRNRLEAMIGDVDGLFVEEDLCGAVERLASCKTARENAAFCQEAELLEFYRSKSYRLGRLVSAPLRKCMTLVSRGRRVERNR